jgi:ribosomal protein S18 acetylase RimI-like enzyme
MEDFNLAEARIHHVNQIVQVHLLAFPVFFLSKLGPYFLKVYYRSILKSKDGISLVIIDKSGNVIGFCVGSKQSLGFHSSLIKNNIIDYFLAGLVIMALNPINIIRLIKNLNKKSSSVDDGLYSELLSIAVNPAFRGMGLGNYLLTNFEKMALEKGCRDISLTTDFYDNESIINFYFKSGYTIMATFNSYPNRKMYRLKKTLN